MVKILLLIVLAVLFVGGLVALSGTPAGEKLVQRWENMNESAPVDDVDPTLSPYGGYRGHSYPRGQYPLYPVRPRSDPRGYRREGPDYSDPEVRRSLGFGSGSGKTDPRGRADTEAGRDNPQGAYRK